MKKKRNLALFICIMIVAVNSALVYAKTDSATRSFTDKATNVLGTAKVTISSGIAGVNTVKSNGSISGSGVWMTSSQYYCTKVDVKTYLGTMGYKMYNGRKSGSAVKKEYCAWQATMKMYYNNKYKCGWTVCCS